jgi:hypothetical protein
MKKFSILIPSRGRPKDLEYCIDSLFCMAHNPRRVEVIYRVDEDDPMLSRYSEAPGVKKIIGPRYHGYASNWRFIEDCAGQSFGNYLMQMVDTAQMLTTEWDMIYEEAIMSNPIAVVASKVLNEHGNLAYCWSFPLITRQLYALAGCFCLGQNPSVDRCWEAFAEEMDCGLIAPVNILHKERRGSDQEDDTARESLCFYAGLHSNWDKRSSEFRQIGKRYAEIVKGKLNES